MNTNGNPGNSGDEALLRAVGRLPRDIEPPRDLWAGIEAAIHAPVPAAKPAAFARPRLVSWPYALAAAVGCVALGALLTFALLRFQQDPPVTLAAAPEGALPEEVTFTEASFGGYESLGPEYEQARAQLAIGLAERLQRLPPEAQLKVERNLAEIRRSLREINVALALDPNSILLQQLLLSAYQSELALLANVNQIAGDIPARSET